jgi:hypothetical protein
VILRNLQRDLAGGLAVDRSAFATQLTNAADEL